MQVKKLIAAILAAALLSAPAMALGTLKDGDIAIKAPSAILMEKSTGTVLYAKDAHRRMPPASVTKVMTMLLIVEAIENGDISPDDMVTASQRASTFGGSCVYLEQGEKAVRAATCSSA
jgi:D-alanyl-D-alanine carboxypeptidase (penicillin-binding protein 5/6)